jgi:HEPN domain-containing protein
MNKKTELLKRWLYKANEDIEVIIRLSSEQPELYTSAITFHAQQATEKFFKAYLVYKDKEFPRTHDVDFLLMECMAFDKTGFEEIDLKNISEFAVAVRYPDDFLVPSI